jgi:hypothetical protein
MYQREALWLGFSAAPWKPNAVAVAVGGINVISGEPSRKGLNADPQDYIVCPLQPWLDGINTGRGSVRQFVAMPLGAGFTVEGAATGDEILGGIQITVFEAKPGRFPDKPPADQEKGPIRLSMPGPSEGVRMGIGAGGVLRQKIYPDPYGIDVWDQKIYGSVLVHIVNSRHFRAITGADPPPTPVDAKTYTEYGFPWFDLYDEAEGDVAPSAHLAGIRTIAERAAEIGETVEEGVSFEVAQSQVRKVRRRGSRRGERGTSSPVPKGDSPRDGGGCS